MTALPEKIMSRVRSHGDRWVCTPKDFLDLGNRPAVDQALSRLVKSGRLRRAARGLYDVPRYSELMGRVVPADMFSAIDAVIRRDGLKVLPGGMAAANSLGLTTAVPAKAIFVTDGPTRTVAVGRRKVWFQHAGPKVMHWSGRPAAQAVQALRWLGPRIATGDPSVASILANRLPDEVKGDLRENLGVLPGWMVPLVRDIITSDRAGAT